MPNVDDTKPIDLDAIDTMLPDILRRCALVLADPRSEAGQTSTDLAHAVQAMAPLLTEVRRLANIVARRSRGKRPKLPDDGCDGLLDESIEACRIVGIDILGDYDYLGTLRRLVRERNAAQADLARVTTERDEVRALQAEQQRAFVEGLRVANKAARTEGARLMHVAVKRALIVDDTEDANDWLDAADRALRLDPVTVTAEVES